MRPLTALLLSDGKPGHYHQAEGVIAAVARLRPTTTIRIELRRRLLVPTRWLLALVNLGVAPQAVLRVGYGLDAGALPAADLVVSAGGETLAANAAAAKHLRSPNIFCGRLRRLDASHVRVIIVTLEDLASSPNHLVALPPSPFDGTSSAAERPTGVRYDRTHPPRTVGVLIGGNAGTFRYTETDWVRLTRFLRAAHAAHGIRWLVATSRRSGDLIGDMLGSMARDNDSGIERFIDFRTGGPGTLPDIFAKADTILCTDDSTSMLSEAIGARLPVVAVSPEAARLEEREAAYRDHLARRGWYRRLPLAQLSPEAFLDALAEIEPRATSQLQVLAEALQGRLPELAGRASG